MTLEQYLENYGLCQENEDETSNQRHGPLFRQFTTIIKTHTETRCENMKRSEKAQNGSCVIKLITVQS